MEKRKEKKGKKRKEKKYMLIR